MERCGKSDQTDQTTGKPLCAVHGEPMHHRGPNSGRNVPWQCSVTHGAARRRSDRKRATANDLELLQKLRHQLLGGTE